MRFLKGLAISLLSFLLFTSLSLFGTIFMLNQTLLNPDFVTSQINKLDLPSLVKETGIIEQISRDMGQQFGRQFPQGEELITQALYDTMTDLEPWVKEQVSEVTYSALDYLKGNSQSLSLVISLEPVKSSLTNNLRETILESPQLAATPPAVREQIVSGIEQALTQELPATFDLKESALSPEVQGTLQQVRQAVSYFQTAYPLLIGFMLLLVLGIILISRQVKSTTRSLGTPCLTYGVLGYAAIFASPYLLAILIEALGLSPSLQEVLVQFLAVMSDSLAPMQTFSIAVAAAGLVLVIVSIVYRREKPSRTVSEDEQE